MFPDCVDSHPDHIETMNKTRLLRDSVEDSVVDVANDAGADTGGDGFDGRQRNKARMAMGRDEDDAVDVLRDVLQSSVSSMAEYDKVCVNAFREIRESATTIVGGNKHRLDSLFLLVSAQHGILSKVNATLVILYVFGRYSKLSRLFRLGLSSWTSGVFEWLSFPSVSKGLKHATEWKQRVKERLASARLTMRDLRRVDVSEDELLVSKLDRWLRAAVTSLWSSSSNLDPVAYLLSSRHSRQVFGFAGLLLWIILRLRWLKSRTRFRPYAVMYDQRTYANPVRGEKPERVFHSEQKFNLQHLMWRPESSSDYDRYRTYGKDRTSTYSLYDAVGSQAPLAAQYMSMYSPVRSAVDPSARAQLFDEDLSGFSDPRRIY
eukprot:ANDGO_03852.mRNA.1 hypothetical protein